MPLLTLNVKLCEFSYYTPSILEEDEKAKFLKKCYYLLRSALCLILKWYFFGTMKGRAELETTLTHDGLSYENDLQANQLACSLLKTTGNSDRTKPMNLVMNIPQQG